MSFQIQCTIDGDYIAAVSGDKKTAEIIECDGNASGDCYWPIRFAVDDFIARLGVPEGGKITVESGAVKTHWVVRTRQLNAIAPGQSASSHSSHANARTLRFGELVQHGL